MNSKLEKLAIFCIAIVGLASRPALAAYTNACPSSAATLGLMRRFANQLLVQKDPTGAYATFASPDMVQLNPPFGKDLASTIVQWHTMTDRSSSSFEIQAIKVHGDTAVIRFLGHLGPGQTAAVTQHDQLRCGKITREWAEFRILENHPSAGG